jgi:methanol metabolism-related c-type cytochrome
LLQIDGTRRPRRLIAGAFALLLAASCGFLPGFAQAQQAAGDEPGKTQEREAVVEEQQAKTEESWEEKPYEVVDGKVDFGTYNGYRRYHSFCHVCHGPDGLGSSYAPAMVDSIPRIGYQGYVEAVVYGKKDVSQSQQLVMPAFGEVADVINYIDDIYAYLKARADGAIGRGRPERLPK